MRGKWDVLEEYFGYRSFRPGQEALVDGLLAGRDVFGLMPTGAGKSLCYQVPALAMDGVTLVVSPLISLMKDQVASLIQSGVRAAYLNSSLTARQYQLALERAGQGQYKIIYVAPERLLTEGFQRLAGRLAISLVAVDEAHCVSQWGQDFRPSYLKIRQFVEGLPHRPPVGAFTATATAQVRRDVVQLLGLRDPVVQCTGFDRPNLFFQVEKPADKDSALLAHLREAQGQSGIVYCATRKTVEEVCLSLNAAGFSAVRYHAGLSDEERRRNQEDFLYDRASVMVATNAFGMEIDKSNVSFVIHYNMPKNMEGYYQEAGRAGRDGSPAKCILLYSGQDVVTNRFLIQKGSEENEELDEEQRERVRRLDEERLKKMTFYCFTSDCLRAYILRYFGETAPDHCENCGNCLTNFEEQDVTEAAAAILACVRACGQRYGRKTIAAVLLGGEKGKRNETARRHSLDELPQFGSLSGLQEHTVYEMMRFLEEQGLLAVSPGEYPVLQLTPQSARVLQKGERVRMKLPKEQEAPQRRRSRKAVEIPDTQRPELFSRLRALRSRLAARQGVPAYVVLTDRALREIAALMPRSEDELLAVNGMGRAKLEKYGRDFLSVVREYREETGKNS